MTEKIEVKNKFEFVVVAGARARQLLRGCTPRTEGPEKPARLAALEDQAGPGAEGRRQPRSSEVALDRARRIGRHRRLQGGRGRARAAEARPRRRGDHDALGAPVRRRGDVRSDHAAPRHHRPVRRGANADIEHIALATDIGAAARRAGDGEHHRQVRARHRRRLPQLALSGDARAGADGAGDEHQHARARRGAREPGDAGGARRALRRSRRGLSRLRLDRQGPARRAGGDRRGRRARCSRRRARCSAGCVVVTAGPTYEDIDAVRYIGNRSSGKMGYAVAAEAARRGARVVLVSGPSHADAAGGRRAGARAQRRARCTPRVQRHAADADIVVMAAAVADYTPERRGRRQDRKERRRRSTLSLVRTPDILADARTRARRRRARRCSSASRPRAAIRSSADAQKLQRKRCRPHRRQRHLAATDAGFDADSTPRRSSAATATRPFRSRPRPQLAAVILDRAERLLVAARRRPADGPARSSPSICASIRSSA